MRLTNPQWFAVVLMVAAGPGCRYQTPDPIPIAGCYAVDWRGWSAEHERALGFRLPSAIELRTDRVHAKDPWEDSTGGGSAGMLMLPADGDTDNRWWFAAGTPGTVTLHWGARHTALVLTVPLNDGQGGGEARWEPNGYAAGLDRVRGEVARAPCEG